MFKRRKIGPLVGKRTWGGLVATSDTPPFVDGGSMIAPRFGFSYDLAGDQEHVIFGGAGRYYDRVNFNFSYDEIVSALTPNGRPALGLRPGVAA